MKEADIGGGQEERVKAFCVAPTQEKLWSFIGCCTGFLNLRCLNCRLQEFGAIVKKPNMTSITYVGQWRKFGMPCRYKTLRREEERERETEREIGHRRIDSSYIEVPLVHEIIIAMT